MMETCLMFLLIHVIKKGKTWIGLKIYNFPLLQLTPVLFLLLMSAYLHNLSVSHNKDGLFNSIFVSVFGLEHVLVQY